MKILVITDVYPIVANPMGGIFVVKRLEFLKKLGVGFKVFSTVFHESLLLSSLKKLVKRSLDPLPKLRDIEFQMLPLKIGVLEYIFSGRLINALNKTVKRMEESLGEDFDIVHAHGMYGILPAGLVAKVLSERLKVPYVVTLHGSDVNRNMPKKRDLFLEVLESASAVIFVSAALKERAVSLGYSGKNSVVIPNGYDPDVFYPMDKELVRKDLGIYREGYKYVGFVGNLVRVKRADRLPKIFDMVAKKRKKTFFIIVGDGPFKKKIERKMRKRNLEFVVTGRLKQEEVAKWMNAMDIMVLPSRSEGWPCVVLEAQACGTAVVGSDRGGIPEAVGFREFVVKDGENFERRFAERVVSVLENGYNPEDLIRRSEEFTWENQVKKEIEVYRGILADVT